MVDVLTNHGVYKKSFWSVLVSYVLYLVVSLVLMLLVIYITRPDSLFIFSSRVNYDEPIWGAGIAMIAIFILTGIAFVFSLIIHFLLTLSLRLAPTKLVIRIFLGLLIFAYGFLWGPITERVFSSRRNLIMDKHILKQSNILYKVINQSVKEVNDYDGMNTYPMYQRHKYVYHYTLNIVNSNPNDVDIIALPFLFFENGTKTKSGSKTNWFPTATNHVLSLKLKPGVNNFEDEFPIMFFNKLNLEREVHIAPSLKLDINNPEGGYKSVFLDIMSESAIDWDKVYDEQRAFIFQVKPTSVQSNTELN